MKTNEYDKKDHTRSIESASMGGPFNFVNNRGEDLIRAKLINGVQNNCFQVKQLSKITKDSQNGIDDYSNLCDKIVSIKNKISFCHFLLSNDTAYSLEDGQEDNFKLKPLSGQENNIINIYENLTPEAKGRSNYWIGWPPYCTGDLPSMTAAILMGFPHGIRIHKSGNANLDDKIAELNSYLGGEIDTYGNNKYLITDKGIKGVISENTLGTENLKFSWLTRVVATGEYQDESSKKLSETIPNEDFNKGYNAKAREIIRNTWLGDDVKSYDSKIETFLDEKYNIKAEDIKGKKVVFIWIRKSGERGGAHYENDTSFNEVENYINMNSDKISYFFLVGDEKGGKAQNIADKLEKVYNLTEFWKKGQGIEDWGGNTRTGQFRLYDYINRIAKVTHIGSMSGGLEALALLGHKVKFKAKKGEIGVKRMEQYGDKFVHRLSYYKNAKSFVKSGIGWFGSDTDKVKLENKIKTINANKIDYLRIDFFNDDNKKRGFEKSSAKYYAFFSSKQWSATVNRMLSPIYTKQKDNLNEVLKMINNFMITRDVEKKKQLKNSILHLFCDNCELGSNELDKYFKTHEFVVYYFIRYVDVENCIPFLQTIKNNIEQFISGNNFLVGNRTVEYNLIKLYSNHWAESTDWKIGAPGISRPYIKAVVETSKQINRKIRK